MATIEVTSLEQYLQIHVDLRKKHNLKTSLAYVCFEDFVLQHGELFTEISPHQPVAGRKGNRYRPRIMKACFQNAYCAAVASKGHLRYAEGYADGNIMPVHHAWNLDPEGRVVDTTWCHPDGAQMPTVGKAYMGLTFPIEYVRSMRTKDNCSIIDQWQKGWPLLQNRYEGVAA
jgi:hypothetical protein